MNLQLAVPSIAPLMCGQTAAMLRACESSDQFKASLEEEHRSMATFHIECHQVAAACCPCRQATRLLQPSACSSRQRPCCCSFGHLSFSAVLQVLTPLQEARALLEAHPGNPDPWLISGAQAAMCRAAAACTLLSSNTTAGLDSACCKPSCHAGGPSCGLLPGRVSGG